MLVLVCVSECAPIHSPIYSHAAPINAVNTINPHKMHWIQIVSMVGFGDGSTGRVVYSHYCSGTDKCCQLLLGTALCMCGCVRVCVWGCPRRVLLFGTHHNIRWMCWMCCLLTTVKHARTHANTIQISRIRDNICADLAGNYSRCWSSAEPATGKRSYHTHQVAHETQHEMLAIRIWFISAQL